MDPPNKKARLRRGLALEKLGLDALAGADMVLLLAEDKTIPQVQERSRAHTQSHTRILLQKSGDLMYKS